MPNAGTRCCCLTSTPSSSRTAQPQLRHISFEKFVYLPCTHRHELLAYRRFLNGECLLGFAHRGPITTRCHSAGDGLPDPSLLFLVSPKKFVAAEFDVSILTASVRP